MYFKMCIGLAYNGQVSDWLKKSSPPLPITKYHFSRKGYAYVWILPHYIYPLINPIKSFLLSKEGQHTVCKDLFVENGTMPGISCEEMTHLCGKFFYASFMNI